MSKKNEETKNPMEYAFPPPESKTSFLKFIYNKKENSYLGRTPKNWGQLLIFYTIFYIVLAGLFAICMQGLLSSLSDNEPKWKLESSIIGTSPGLGFRPFSEDFGRGAIIQFDTKKVKEGNYWVKLLNEFLGQYNSTGKKEKFCSFNQTIKSEDVCIVDIDNFGSCSPENNYGYKNGRPCVFLKLNKIFGWKPETYDDPNNLPEEMPEDLKKHIADTPPSQRQQVWISCKGHHSLDKENLGPISYYPARGFPMYYFPYLNQPGYLNPLIAVQFEKLKINNLVNVECRAWAKNIEYSHNANHGRTGSVVFQLFID